MNYYRFIDTEEVLFDFMVNEPVAKKYGVPVRILHSHNSRGADSWIKRVRNHIMSHIAIKSVTHRFACSKVAAEYLYGDDNAFILNMP